MGSVHITQDWQLTPVHYDDMQLWPAQQEGHAFGVLLVVRSYDLESGLF